MAGVVFNHFGVYEDALWIFKRLNVFQSVFKFHRISPLSPDYSKRIKSRGLCYIAVRYEVLDI